MGNRIKSFFIAFLIYATSIAQAPQLVLYGLIFLIGVYYSGNILKKRLGKADLILVFFILFTVVVFVLGKSINKNVGYVFIDAERSKDIYPYTIALWGTIFFSRSLTINVMRYLLYFICFEACVALVEFLFGIQYIIYPGRESGTNFGLTDLLYFNRVYGLSPNVSALGIKLVVGVVLVFFLNHWKYLKKSKTTILFVLLLTAAIFSFQRTAILTIIFFVFLYLFSYFRGIKSIYRFLIILMITGTVIALISNMDYIVFQFTRGKTTGLTDIRTEIFGIYIDYIQNNVLWGNFAEKIYIMIGGHSYHSHNSFLQMIATIGIPAFLIWMFYMGKIVNRKSLVFILPFFIYSMTQYGIFWGCSLFDIALYSIIFQSQKHIKYCEVHV